MKMSCVFTSRCLAMLITTLAFHGLFAGAAWAIQPTPPVSIEIQADKPESRDWRTLTAVISITANVEVGKPVLYIDTKQRLEIESELTKISLRLAPKKETTLRVPIRVDKAGVYPIEFRVEAYAKGFELAGGAERRYVVADGKKPPRLVTGKELRREQRIRTERKLEEVIKKDPDAGVSIDTFLRRPLKTLKMAPGYEKKIQPLVPPAAGIEPYEEKAVIDSTADVIRDLDPITVQGRIFYTDRNGTTQPLINATVDIRDDDVGPDEQLTAVVTGWDGRFLAVVNNDDGWFQNGRDIYIRVRATNSRFRVQDCSYWPDWTYSWVSDTRDDLSDGTVVDFGNLATVANNEASILFQDLNQGWNFLTTSGAQDPGFVDLCFPEDSSVYSTFWEEIDIEDGDEVARDIVLHEYGHATMHNAYDGYWPPNTGGAHTFDDILHQNMAFTEGWGTFIALAINDDGVYHSNGWSRSIENFTHVSGHTDGDGQVNEGHVAAGMHDVRDANSDGDCAADNCDSSGPDAALMSQIWRDSFWRSEADNIGEYWPRLCGELSSAQADTALKTLAFNEIDLSSCKCTVELAAAGTPRSGSIVADLRSLRDLGLRKTALGERIIELYYRHTDEVAKMVLKDEELRDMAFSLFSRAARGYIALKKDVSSAVILDAKHAALARSFIERVQKQGSEALKRDFDLVLKLVDDLEGRTANEIRRKLQRQPKGK